MPKKLSSTDPVPTPMGFELTLMPINPATHPPTRRTSNKAKHRRQKLSASRGTIVFKTVFGHNPIPKLPKKGGKA